MQCLPDEMTALVDWVCTAGVGDATGTLVGFVTTSGACSLAACQEIYKLP